jgi:hypothetical protein
MKQVSHSHSPESNFFFYLQISFSSLSAEDHATFLKSLSKEQPIFFYNKLSTIASTATPAAATASPINTPTVPSGKSSFSHQSPSTRHSWDNPSSSAISFPVQPTFLLEGDNVIRRSYPHTCFPLTQMGENIITSRTPAHLIHFCQLSSLRSETNIIFGSDQKLKTTAHKVVFGGMKD